MLTLTREVRFGLDAEPASIPSNSANGFAGNPVLAGIGPFLTLSVALSGAVDAATGMLINIKQVDRQVREHAVKLLRAGAAARQPVEAMLLAVRSLLAEKFSPHTLATVRLGVSPYLSFTISHREPAMVQVSLRFEFSAAHRLHSTALSAAENLEVFGRCTNPNGHGHNYELEVTVSGTPNAKSGEVIAIPILQQIVNTHVLDVFDHKHLNLDCPEFSETGGGGVNPTVENIARVVFRRLKGQIPAPARLANVRLWETPKTMCEYSE